MPVVKGSGQGSIGHRASTRRRLSVSSGALVRQAANPYSY
jgi:hypothetical protein